MWCDSLAEGKKDEAESWQEPVEGLNCRSCRLETGLPESAAQTFVHRVRFNYFDTRAVAEALDAPLYNWSVLIGAERNDINEHSYLLSRLSVSLRVKTGSAVASIE